MDPTCQECKQKAEFICFCNDTYMCKGCREVHKKKFKGPHKILLFNDPDLENIRTAFKFPKGKPESKAGEAALEKKKQEDPPALVEEKKKLKNRLAKEIGHIEEFKGGLIKSITGQAGVLVQSLVSQYSAVTDEFTRNCKEIEKNLEDALDYLSMNEDISGNALLCKMLDFPDLNSADLVEVKSTIHEDIITLENTLTLKVEFVKFDESNQVMEYYNVNKETMVLPLKALFEEVLTEKHFGTAAIKLTKVPLVKETLNQLAIIIPSFPALKTISLAENDLGADGIKRLGPLLTRIQTLRQLSIAKNQLKGPGGKALATNLKELKELLSLDLSGNKFGFEGIKAICLSLQGLTKLKTLKLMSNGLGNECANAIISCLPVLKKLKTLRLGGNSFHAEEQALIEEHVVDKCDVKF